MSRSAATLAPGPGRRPAAWVAERRRPGPTLGARLSPARATLALAGWSIGYRLPEEAGERLPPARPGRSGRESLPLAGTELIMASTGALSRPGVRSSK